MSKINKDLLDELNEMINKMDRACYIYRCNVELAKKLNVELPGELKDKIGRLAIMSMTCEKVEYYYRSKDDILFGDWVRTNDQPEPEESELAINLLNQYRWLKYEVGDVEYFIPDELCGKWGMIWQWTESKQ